MANFDYFTGGKGPLHYGVCSNYLNEIEEGDRIVCYFRK